MAEIKAINTIYNGCNFRNDLEARCAVFFDALGINWEYENNDYDFDKCGKYLPDFWLPQVDMYVEVKPIGGFTKDFLKIIKHLTGRAMRGILLIEGIPGEMPVINGYYYYNEDGVIECQYELYNCHRYHLTESRFFSNPGWWPECDYGPYEITPAYVLARSARFEHGESGAT